MKVLVTARLEASDLKQLRDLVEIEISDWYERRLSSAELAEKLAGVSILITEIDTVSADLLALARDLKVVIDCRGNPVNVDVAAATAAGVLVVNTPGRNADSVAEVTIALLLMSAHKLFSAARAVVGGEWGRQGKGSLYRRMQGIELGGRTLGLVGLGAVGRGVARRLGPFGMRILAFDPYVKAEAAAALDVTLADLDRLCAESDFISMHVHVTPETERMIGDAQFARMKPQAYFINAGRAGAVDERALYTALQEGKIAGAAFDVYHQEPLPAESPLFAMEQVILLPHIAGNSADIPRHQSRIAVEEVRRLIAGARPLAIVNPEVLEAQSDFLKNL